MPPRRDSSKGPKKLKQVCTDPECHACNCTQCNYNDFDTDPCGCQACTKQRFKQDLMTRLISSEDIVPLEPTAWNPTHETLFRYMQSVYTSLNDSCGSFRSDNDFEEKYTSVGAAIRTLEDQLQQAPMEKYKIIGFELYLMLNYKEDYKNFLLQTPSDVLKGILVNAKLCLYNDTYYERVAVMGDYTKYVELIYNTRSYLFPSLLRDGCGTMAIPNTELYKTFSDKSFTPNGPIYTIKTV